MILTDIYYKEYGSVLDNYREKIKREAMKEIEKLKETVKITNYLMGSELNIYYE